MVYYSSSSSSILYFIFLSFLLSFFLVVSFFLQAQVTVLLRWLLVMAWLLSSYYFSSSFSFLRDCERRFSGIFLFLFLLLGLFPLLRSYSIYFQSMPFCRINPRACLSLELLGPFLIGTQMI